MSEKSSFARSESRGGSGAAQDGGEHSGTYDVKGAAAQIEKSGRDLLHTGVGTREWNEAHDKIYKELDSIPRDQQGKVARQIETDNKSRSLDHLGFPNIDVKMQGGEIAGIDVHASIADKAQNTFNSKFHSEDMVTREKFKSTNEPQPGYSPYF